MIRKIQGIVAMIIVASVFFWCFHSYAQNREVIVPKEEIEEEIEMETSSADVVIWYSDSALESYLNDISESYFKKNNVSVAAIYVSSVDFLETVNNMNISGKGAPDIYITGSEMLEKIYLSGLYRENTDTDTYNEDDYPKIALNCVTYEDKMLAYPLSFNVSFLACNTDNAKTLPESFDEIKSFANSFVPEEGSNIQSILKWNVSDLLYNYPFVGAYVNLGGESGLDYNKVDIYNANALKALQYYQNLNTIFAVNMSSVSEEKVEKEFFDQKTVFSILDCYSVPSLESADFNLDIVKFPKLNDSLGTKALSETSILVINPYTKNVEKSEAVAKYMTYDYADKMYEKGALQCCRYLDKYAIDFNEKIMSYYEDSTSLPKFRVTGDYWLSLQNMLNNVWSGSDAEEALSALQENIKEKMQIYK